MAWINWTRNSRKKTLSCAWVTKPGHAALLCGHLLNQGIHCEVIAPPHKALPELFGKTDNDAFRPADVG
jgi:hypothetical protein